MPYDFVLVGEEFLEASDLAFEECARGLSDLDRIIVAVPDLLVDRARGYLVTLLYAYWERFFRNVFGEYLRCLSLAGVRFEDVDEKLLRHKLTRQLAAFLRSNSVSSLVDLPQRSTPTQVKSALQKLRDELDAPLNFENPSKWVEPESNVKFGILEAHCKRFCIDLESIKNSFESDGSLFNSLNTLVADRNDIAHGAVFTEQTQGEWQRKRNFVLKLMQVLQTELYRCLVEGSIIRRISS
jgi:hypothetical protein